jgi:hypothetical protein
MRAGADVRALIACMQAIACGVISGVSFAQIVVEETPPSELADKVMRANAAVEKGGQGPFRAVLKSDAGLPTHSLYLPEDLTAAARKGKLPIIAWGNGACANYGNRFRYFLTEIASHGYFILSIGPKGPSTVEWKIDLTPNPDPPAADRPVNSFAMQLIDAIDWALAENARKGSPYYNKLDPRRIAVMGQSCGGLQTVSAAADKRVKTAVIWNSGTFPLGTRPLAGTGDATKQSLKRLHTPVAWITGDESDTAWKNSNEDFDAVSHIPAFRAWKKGVGHSVHYREPLGGDFTPVAIAWLDWQLKGSLQAKKMFIGTECTLCTDSAWVVKHKGF